jgi:hypothetical protein
VRLTIKENGEVPQVITDCMALIHAARAGPEAAARGSKADARIWKEIADLTGHCFKQLQAKITWMPAHTAAAEAQRVKSNGTVLTAAEWRANQLADSLAKKGAAKTALRDKSDAMILLAGDALQQSAARLGVATLAANRHAVVSVSHDGSSTTTYSRDSSAMPKADALARRIKTEAKSVSAEGKRIAASASIVLVKPICEPTLKELQTARRKKARHGLASAERSREEAATAAAIQSTVAMAKPQPLVAADRMARLRARVVAIASGGAA